MPFDVQAAERLLLGPGFLHVVFAERALTEDVQGANPLRGVPFADCQQRDFAGFPARFAASCRDPCTDIVKILF